MNQRDSQPWYKERWPWLLMAGPAIVIVAAIITIWLAVVSNDGLVSDDYYKQGLAVNQRLQRDHQAASMGLQADLMRSGTGLRLLLTSGDVQSLPVEVKVKLSHPTIAGRDQLVSMASEGMGFYSGVMAGELSGRWIVSIEDPDGRWRLQGEWKGASDEPLRLRAHAN